MPASDKKNVLRGIPIPNRHYVVSLYDPSSNSGVPNFWTGIFSMLRFG
jgi:hypothetical protein